MKVLWLTNTPAGASEYFNEAKMTGGWISALEAYIKKTEGITLGVCFFHNKSSEFSFQHKSVTYYPVKEKNRTLLKKIWSKLFNQLDDSNPAHLLRVIEDFKPDIIQLFGTESGLGEVLEKVNIPHIIHIQGLINPCLQAWFPKGVSQRTLWLNSSIKNQLIKKGVLGQYYKFKKMALREQKILLSSKNVFGRTQWDRETVALYNKKINYFHCDELIREPFFKAKWKLTNSHTLSLVSTMHPNIYKGLEVILQTAYILKEKAHVDFKWTIIGVDVNDHLVKLIERIEKKCYKDNNVIFAGLQNSAELIETLLSSDIYVHPSHIDNSPNSVCEAMLLGMPVIAGNVGGLPSIIEDKVNGFLYNSHDPFALAALLAKAKSQNLEDIGKMARIKAIERHDATTIVKTIVTAYQKLIKESET